MSPLGSPLRSLRTAILFAALLVGLLALEVWGIHSSIAGLLR
jgi:hypothetical protein